MCGYGLRTSGARSRKSCSRHASVSTITSVRGISASHSARALAVPWPSAARRMPTASISSMKTMHWPPHLAACLRARQARKRTSTASMPMKVEAKPEPGMDTNGQLKDVAIAFESIVLPVPGAPRKSTPRSRLPPALTNSSPDCQSVTTRVISSRRLHLAADV